MHDLLLSTTRTHMPSYPAIYRIYDLALRRYAWECATCKATHSRMGKDGTSTCTPPLFPLCFVDAARPPGKNTYPCLSLHTFSQSVMKGSNFTIGIKHKCMTLYSNSGSIFIQMNAICSPKWDSCSSSLVTLFSKKALVTLAFVSIATRSGTRGPNRQTSTSTCGRRTYNVCVCVWGGDTKASVKTMQPFSLVQAALHPRHMKSKSDSFSID